ncbi:hypothetical protein SMICM17S_12005 [Streptomyces microflavus]
MREVGGEHVPFTGHRGQLRVRGDQLLGFLQRPDDHHVLYEAVDGGHQGGGPAHEVGDGGRGEGGGGLGTAVRQSDGVRGGGRGGCGLCGRRGGCGLCGRRGGCGLCGRRGLRAGRGFRAAVSTGLRGQPARGGGHAGGGGRAGCGGGRAGRSGGDGRGAGVRRTGPARLPLYAYVLTGLLRYVMGPGLRSVAGHRAQQHRRAPRVPFAQQPDRVGRRGRVRDGHRVRRRAEGGRDRDLVTGLDGEQFGGGAEESGQPVPGAEQRPRTVLAAQPQGQRLVPGRDRRPPALGGRRLLAGGAVGGLGPGECLLGLLVAGGQLLVVRVEAFDLGPELLVLLLGGVRPLLCLVAGRGQPVDLGLRRTGPAAGRVDLAVRPGPAPRAGPRWRGRRP